MSKTLYSKVVGGEIDPKHSFKRTVFHSIDMVLESILRPRNEAFGESLSQLAEELSQTIHKDLSDHIPKLDSDILSVSSIDGFIRSPINSRILI